MCYSAQLAADHGKHLRALGARVDFPAFEAFYAVAGPNNLRRPKVMDSLFAAGGYEPQSRIHSQIQALNRERLIEWQAEIEQQRLRLAAAEEVIASGKTTKKALNDQRIAGDKIRRLTRSIRNLQDPAPSDAGGRIFPMWYAPVIVWGESGPVVRPMRYHCRPVGKPASYDRRYPGLYNCRLDNAEGFWKQQFGHTHGLLLVSAFYENVARHDLEGRELSAGEQPENVVLEFRPSNGALMHVACLWSRWVGADGEELLSFAAITDEPPPEVRAAGHDRCIIPIAPSRMEEWLRPAGRVDQAYELLAARERPYYSHQAAA